MQTGAYIIVKGMVQGVGYRYFAYRQAILYHLKGWVRNLPNGNVELEVEGEQGLLREFIRQLKIGPRFSHVTDVVVSWKEFQDKFTSFDISY
jgi:acylphosphatase